MSVLRQLNILGQMRLDVPHLRSIESSIAADFDVTVGRIQTGERAVVVRGFTLANFTAGTAANSVQLTTADGILCNMNASESGTFLWVSADRTVETLNSATNYRVSGSFTAGQVNYIGLDLIRSADSTTSDLVQFLDPNTLLENPKTVPLGRTLDYRIVISTTPFSSSPNLVPIAKIKTDASNNVDSATGSVQDARNILWRLGAGGDFPNRYSSFSWAQNRVEYTSGSGIFTGGDKSIQSQKDWMDAIMTRLWELGGGENWYSSTADRNVRMVRAPASVFSSTGDNFEYVSSNLHWQGLRVVFDNSNTSGVYYNTVIDQNSNSVGLTDLVNGECIYVDIDRTSNAAVVAKKATLQLLSVPSIPGSRFILAWMQGGDVFTRDASLPVNVSFQPATTVVAGAVRLNETPNSSHASAGVPTVVTLNSTNSITIGGVGYPIVGTADGATITGGGTGKGAVITGGATGGGAVISAGASANADGLYVTGRGSSGRGIFAQATGSGAGGDINALGAGTGLVVTSQSGIGATITTISGSARGLDVSSQTGEGLRVTSAGGIAINAIAGGNNVGVTSTGAGTGAGGSFTGGATGRGLNAVGNSTAFGANISSVGGTAINAIAGGNGTGIISAGSGSGVGGNFIGGTGGAGIVTTGGTDSANAGIEAYGGAGGGIGGYFTGTLGQAGSISEATGSGIGSDGRTVNGYGVSGTASGTGVGVLGQGGLTSGAGVVATARGGNSYGVDSTGHGTSAGVKGTGGSSNGAGGDFTPGGAGHAIVLNASSGKAVAITTNTNIAYTSGRTMKQYHDGYSFGFTLDTNNYNKMIAQQGRLGLVNPTSTTILHFYKQFSLPLNAVITQVRVTVLHTGATGGVTADFSVFKTTRSDVISGPPYGWTQATVVSLTSLGIAAAGTGEIFSPAVTAVVADKTVNSLDEVFTLDLYATVPATSGIVYLPWVEITYTMYDTLKG